MFSRHGKIIIIDIETARRREIASGTSPAWSQDGMWISFTSPDMVPMLVDPSNLKQVELWGGRKLSGPIAWAPDSCCISFSARGKDIEGMIYPGGRIIIYRIKDGEWFPLSGFSFGIGSSARHNWFYDYKAFLARNESRKTP
ncbi:MAG TPA: hypothetical protein VG056_04815 [Pirellulales bacterium]|nr:hypothetical protein [Pirellulales bacterium]